MTATARTQTLPPNYRRNMFWLMNDYIFFVIAISLVSRDAVLPDFIGKLTDSEVLVGLSSIIFPLGLLLPQLVFAPAVARAGRKLPWVRVPGVMGRTMLFVVAAGIVVFGASESGVVLVIVFFGYGIFAFSDGIAALGWMEIIGTVLPNERHGRMFGRGRVIYSLIVLFVVSGLVRYILDPQTTPSFPNDYALLFFLAGLCLMISIVGFFFIKESPPSPQTKAATARVPRFGDGYMSFLRQLLRRDRHFQRYISARVVLEASMIAIPFYIRFATESLHILSADAVSHSLQATMLGGIVAGPFFGWLSERRGSRLVILTGCALLAMQPAVALLAGSTGIAELIYLVFALGGMAAATHEPGMLNWIVEYGSEHRSIYFSLASTFKIMGIFSPLVGGIIAEQFSYEALFVLTLAVGIVALGLSWRVAEPRDVLPLAFDF